MRPHSRAGERVRNARDHSRIFTSARPACGPSLARAGASDWFGNLLSKFIFFSLHPAIARRARVRG